MIIRRWIAEIAFSSLKRALGEDLLSKKFKAQKIEAGLKVMLYNKFIGNLVVIHNWFGKQWLRFSPDPQQGY
jgi:hypothetical protein